MGVCTHSLYSHSGICFLKQPHWSDLILYYFSRVFLSTLCTQAASLNRPEAVRPTGSRKGNSAFYPSRLLLVQKVEICPSFCVSSDLLHATLIMHFHCIFRTIIFLSVVVSALIDFSDFTEPYDEPGSLLFDPNTPFDPNTRFDPNTPLFDEEFTVSLDPLTFLDQSTNPEIPSSDILWDDSFKLASCSTLSRVRRADDSASCDYVSSEDDRKIIESLTQGRFSVTCTLLTMGALPWGLIPSDAAQDVVTNSNVFSVATLGYGPRPFFASTLYRATLGITIFPSQCFAIHLIANLTSQFLVPRAQHHPFRKLGAVRLMSKQRSFM